jgi:hypothetical protein
LEVAQALQSRLNRADLKILADEKGTAHLTADLSALRGTGYLPIPDPVANLALVLDDVLAG